MKGLIKKDLLLIKSNFKLLLIMFIAFSFLLINGEDSLGFIPAFLSISIMMSSFSYDEYNKFDAYGSSFPNGKKHVVASKYITTILILLASITTTALLTALIGLAKNNLVISDIIEISIGCLIGVMIFQSVIYPVIFKYGIEKSRIGLFLGIFIIVGAAAIIMKLGWHLPEAISSFFDSYGLIIFAILSIMLLYGSYLLSKHIYLKKEF